MPLKLTLHKYCDISNKSIRNFKLYLGFMKNITIVRNKFKTEQNFRNN